MPHMAKLTRYSLGEKIDSLFIELSELILIAGYTSKEYKLPHINKASIKLDVLKFFLKVTWELKSIETKTYSDLAVSLNDVGKMLGGWQKQLVKETPSQQGRS